jgi:hypothetical protein
MYYRLAKKTTGTWCCFRHFQNSIKNVSFGSVYSNILYQFFLLVDSTYYVTFSGSLNLISRVSIDSKFDIYVDFFRDRVFLFCFRILDNVNHYFLSLASNLLRVP